MERKVKETLQTIFESDNGILQTDKNVIIEVYKCGFGLIMGPDYISQELVPTYNSSYSNRGEIDSSKVDIDLLETLIKFGVFQDYEGKYGNSIIFMLLLLHNI